MKNILILICFSAFFLSCNFDQVTTEYINYKKAVESDFVAMNWIPYELQDSSMTNIYIRSNLNVNTYIFSFSTKQVPTNIPLSLYQITKPLEIHGLEIPKWWNQSILNKPTATFPLNHMTTVSLVLDNKKGKIYGWKKSQ